MNEPSNPPPDPLQSVVRAAPLLTLPQVKVALMEVNHRRDEILAKAAFEKGVALGLDTAKQAPSPVNTNLLLAAEAVLEWASECGVEFPTLRPLATAVLAAGGGV